MDWSLSHWRWLGKTNLPPQHRYSLWIGFRTHASERKSSQKILGWFAFFWSSWNLDLAMGCSICINFPSVHLAATSRGIICILIGSLSFPCPHPQHSLNCRELEPDATACLSVTQTSMSVTLQWHRPNHTVPPGTPQGRWSQNGTVRKILRSCGTCPCTSKTLKTWEFGGHLGGSVS